MKLLILNEENESFLIDINCEENLLLNIETVLKEKQSLFSFLREKKISYIVHRIHYVFKNKLIKNNI